MLILEFCFMFCLKLWFFVINVYYNKFKNKFRGIDFNICLVLEFLVFLFFFVNMCFFLLELGLGGGYFIIMFFKLICRILVS